jgi:hypothetical protein
MLKYSVIDMRTRETVGSVTGETDAECLKKAKNSYESQSRRIVAFPETELTEALSEKERQGTGSEQLEHPTYLQQALAVDASRQQLIDERYTGEDFGFGPGKALVLKIVSAEQALTDWARRLFKLDTNYIARIYMATDDDNCTDYVVVVSEKPNGAG